MSTWSSTTGPFLGKAKEFQAAGQPVIAYYCKLYAASLGMKERVAGSDALLAALFDELERDKREISELEAIQKPSLGAAMLRSLAFRLFLLAERDEQEPTLGRRAQERFSASVRLLQVYRGLFLEEGGLFVGEIEDWELNGEEERRQVEEKSRYAKWRISQLAVRKGSVSGVNGTEATKSNSAESTETSTSNASTALANPGNTITPSNPAIPSTTAPGSTTPTIPSTPTVPSNPANPSNTTTPTSPPSYNLPLQQPILSPSSTSQSQSPVLLIDPKVIAEAEKQARFGISAMHFDDLPTAILHLQRAISLLQQCQQ